MVSCGPLGRSLALLYVDWGDLSLDGTHIVHGKPQNSKGQCTAKVPTRKLVGSGCASYLNPPAGWSTEYRESPGKFRGTLKATAPRQ
jgi:hypothetical protein